MDRNIELYDDETRVLKRIAELKEQGFEETDMYIITDDEEDVSMVRGTTGVIIKEDDDSLWDRFKSFLSGEDSVVDAFNRMKLDEEDRDYYYDKVREGKILLYVDKEYIQYYNLHEDGKFRPIIDQDTPYTPDETIEKDKEIEPLPGEELSDNMKEDLGLDQDTAIEKEQDRARKELLIEEERNRLR